MSQLASRETNIAAAAHAGRDPTASTLTGGPMAGGGAFLARPSFQIAPSKSLQEKGRAPMSARQVAGNSRAGKAQREGVWVMGARIAAKKLGRRVLPQKHFYPVPERMRRDEAAAWFAQILAPFRSGDIAKISGASKEAVKHWKSGKSTPRLDHLINMGRMIEAIANGVEDEMKRPIDPKSISHLLAIAHRIAQTETGEQAAIARAFIRQATGDGT